LFVCDVSRSLSPDLTNVNVKKLSKKYGKMMEKSLNSRAK
jgi:hypothetical protein